ncbi:MAG: CoA transferase subunit A [Herpetosiphonaceae bacterium]|nr:MAG: CoA transferase subunit A [Herpetosiphonaceae bacterium]
MSKLMSMQEAIGRFVHDGMAVAMSLALEPLIPFAAGHEIIRQRRRDLTLIGPISDCLFDQLIGAGCVRRVIAAWVGNVSGGLGHAYRRAAEQGLPQPLEIHDHSNFTIALALRAGALGVPYIPAYTLLGSDLPRSNPGLVQAEYEGRPILHVKAVTPDVAIVQVQRSDEDGNAHAWGNLGISLEAGLASRDIIIVAEEIVPRDVILSDPNRVIAPSFKVRAVVHEPGGAHPSPVQGYYNRDHEFFHAYHSATRTLEGMQSWLQEWVYGIPDRAAYLRKLGAERWTSLQRRTSLLAAPVDYGY